MSEGQLALENTTFFPPFLVLEKNLYFFNHHSNKGVNPKGVIFSFQVMYDLPHSIENYHFYYSRVSNNRTLRLNQKESFHSHVEHSN